MEIVKEVPAGIDRPVNLVVESVIYNLIILALAILGGVFKVVASVDFGLAQSPKFMFYFLNFL